MERTAIKQEIVRLDLENQKETEKVALYEELGLKGQKYTKMKKDIAAALQARILKAEHYYEKISVVGLCKLLHTPYTTSTDVKKYKEELPYGALLKIKEANDLHLFEFICVVTPVRIGDPAIVGVIGKERDFGYTSLCTHADQEEYVQLFLIYWWDYEKPKQQKVVGPKPKSKNGYIPGGNWRLVVYWFAAATLTAMVAGIWGLL